MNQPNQNTSQNVSPDVPDQTAKSASNLPNGLVDDPLFLAFSDAGYEWRDQRPFITRDYDHALFKRFYTVGEKGEHDRAYYLVIAVSNMFRIPGYPRDGSMPRFMFQANLCLHNADAEITLGRIDMDWRVQSVAEAEKPAYYIWNVLGRPRND